ncbi:UNVERIFIED_CONTAM: THAP domain-containing protein 2 [Trichonephila clavipes]
MQQKKGVPLCLILKSLNCNHLKSFWYCHYHKTYSWMPSKCFVLGCRSNYCSELKVRVFSFPRDEILKNQWLQAIQREDKRQPSKASKICALHFKAEDIITEASGFNSKTQEFITVPLQKHRLKPNAVPSVFNNLPRTRKKTWKKISRKTHDRTNIQLLEGSQECVPNSGPSKIIATVQLKSYLCIYGLRNFMLLHF